MTVRHTLQSTPILIALLAIAAFFIYVPSLKNDFVIWDDDSLVYENPLTQAMTPKTVAGAFSSYDPELYVPLTIMSFQVEHALFGFNPLPYHLDNLLMHILNAALIFLLLQRLGLKKMTAFAGALVFVVHPLNTEAVAWVSARKDLLSSAFILGCLLTWRRKHWLSILFFLFALLSKPVAIILPAILLLMDWMERGHLKKSDGMTFAPAVLLSAAFLVIGLYGKAGNISSLTICQTTLLSIKSIAFSWEKFFWPVSLSSIYLQTSPITFTQFEFLFPALLFALFTLLTLFALFQYRWRVPPFAFAFFLLFLIPSFSNFAREGSLYFFSDRYVYLAQIGILFLLGSLLEHLPRQTVWLTTIPVLLFAWTAHARSLVWKDSETLYRDALLMNESSVTMHYNLGLLEQKRGNQEAAMQEYEKALTLNPHHARTLTNMGMLWKERGDTALAMEFFRKAIASNPLYPEPHNNIGSLLMDQGKIDQAITEFRAAIALHPAFAQAHINLGAAYGKKGMYEEGLNEYRIAFELEPRLLENHPELKEVLKPYR